MKVLYAIQGTGNGHLSRATDIVPVLKNKVETHTLVSGVQADLVVPFHIDYKLRGLSFIFGKKGGVDIWKTIRNAAFIKLRREILDLPIKNYDLVINDFEPVSAWAAYLHKVPCISLSHQAAVMNPAAPKPPQSDWVGRSVLKFYAPAQKYYGFHFLRFSHNIFTPVIRKEIAGRTPSDAGHYTVYLPAYSDAKIIDILQFFPDIHWHVFSKHTYTNYEINNIIVRKISNTDFINSMVDATGILCGAGFETPAEALFLGKKLLVVPMRNQYEQQCNAAALETMGIRSIPFLDKRAIPVMTDWLAQTKSLKVEYPDEIELIVENVLNEWGITQK